MHGVIPSGAKAKPRKLSSVAPSDGRRGPRARRLVRQTTGRPPAGGEIPPLRFASVGMTRWGRRARVEATRSGPETPHFTALSPDFAVRRPASHARSP